MLSVEENQPYASQFEKINSLHARIKIIGSNEVEAAAKDFAKQTMREFAKQNKKPKTGDEPDNDAGKLRIRFTDVDKKGLDELKKNV